MIRRLHKMCTSLVLAMGIFHTAYTFFNFNSLTESAVFSAGAGLVAIFVALLNIALWLPEVPAFSRRTVSAANFLFFLWLVAGVTATLGPVWLVAAGIGGTMVITSLLLGREKEGELGCMPNEPLHQTSCVTVCADAKTAPPSAGEHRGR
jgi:hypothetical protein